ncbi:MAG: DUF6074 family protein [Devosia sp.]
MSDRQLDLFAWVPTDATAAPSGAPAVLAFPAVKRRHHSKAEVSANSAAIAAFPQNRRYSKVMDVATKLLAKTTSRAVEHYRWQVADAMSVHLRSRHIPSEQHHEQIRRFWVAVDCEVARRINGRQRPGGAA